jgi:putative phosphoribosyl transferase
MRDREENIHEMFELRGRTGVYRDREEAGRVLAGMLGPMRGAGAVVLAIPSGGVPVASVMARELGLDFDVAVVSKITLPYSSEAGYGAVAFDGSVGLNDGLIERLSLTREQIQDGIEKTFAKVERRIAKFRGGRPLPELSGRSVILVDDGLASGFTMLVAVEAVRRGQASRVICAVPTGHEESVRRLAGEVDDLYCPNIRAGWSFAVADAYESWYDVDEDAAVRIARRFEGAGGEP